MTREEKIAMCKAYYDALCDGASHTLLTSLTDDPATQCPVCAVLDSELAVQARAGRGNGGER